MIIERLKINRLTDPVGFELKHPTVSYVISGAKGTRQAFARILVSETEDFSDPVYDSGERTDIVSTGFELPLTLKPMTRYFWKVQAEDDLGDRAESAAAFFETGKDDAWTAKWITPALDKEVQAVVYKQIEVSGKVRKARAYMTGLGVYEFYLNGEKQGNECLLPGFCDYNTWIQVQTFELELREGKNLIEMVLGDGWYKGWYGLNKTSENYGDRLAAIAEIRIWYEDGREEVITTDPSWKAKKSKVVYSGIYPGEIFDASLDDSEEFDVREIDLGTERLSQRLSPSITIHEHIRPIELIHTPAGETVLDMGQNMVGWLSFKTSAPAGTKLFFQFGEILQKGNFYNDNLRTAKAEFTYIADGEKDVWVRQHFTFYGYRFVKVVGWDGDPDLNDFEGLVIHSEMEELGSIETSDPLVNQLVHNAKWGQKGNFLDVPTDCPQRDERYGWTGDAQIFSGTACYTMDTYAFYTKYGKDVYAEQLKYGGSVPDVVPVANYEKCGSTAWGEAATIIPWNVYLHFGDKGILIRQYDSMKAWVDYMHGQDEISGGHRLWTNGYHYADWLALDGNYKGGVYGATDPHLIASGYYYYSTLLTAKAAGVIGKTEDEAYYRKLSEEIREAFIQEYFTPNGKLAVDTMTAYVVVLYFGLVPENAYEKVCTGLLRKLKRNRYHLETGFVGTPYLCRMLSENGMNELAYHLLLEKGYPGWLYEVLMGATTVWERWNSVEPDGKISGTEMNSLNHYSYGSIVEWMYRNMLGINPVEEAPGFKKFILSPTPNYQIGAAAGKLRSAAGDIESSWKLEDGELFFRFVVPFDTQARIVLPDADLIAVAAQAEKYEGISEMSQEDEEVVLIAEAGVYEFHYMPTVPYRKIYSIDTPLEELDANAKTRAILDEEYYSYVGQNIPFKKELYTLEETMQGPFTNVPPAQQEKIDRLLREVMD